jgi:hypothetical protein
MSVSKFNAEGYYDPTPYEAFRSKDNAPVRRQKDHPRTYVCSPFRGDTERNVKDAIRFCRYALGRGRFPIAPHLFLPRFMDDENHAERKLAMSFGLRLLSGCHEVWVFGERISEGMAAEIAEARRRDIPVRYYTNECKEVSPDGGKEK